MAPATPLSSPSPPPPLEELKLDARDPKESRVQLPRMHELAVALPKLKNRLKTFELTSCEFDDECFAVLVGGLLPLRESLEHVHLEIVKSDISPPSLVFLAHLMKHLSRLESFNFSMQSSKHKLFEGATIEQVNDLVAATQECRAKTLRVEFYNAGMTEVTSAKLLEAATHMQSANFSLRIEDCNFVTSSGLAHRMVELLPHATNCTELSLIDTGEVGDWWNSTMETMVVDALEKNTRLEQFTFRLAERDFSQSNQQRIRSLLQRNAHIGRVQQTLTQPQDGNNNNNRNQSNDNIIVPALWPEILAKVGKPFDGGSSPIFWALRHGVQRQQLAVMSTLEQSLEEEPQQQEQSLPEHQSDPPQEQVQESPPAELNDQEQSQGPHEHEQDLTQQEQLTRPEDQEEQLELGPQPQESPQESPQPAEQKDQEQSQGLREHEQEQQEDLKQQEQQQLTRPQDQEEQLELDPQPQEQAQESPPPVELNDQEQSQGLREHEQEQQQDLKQQEQQQQLARPQDQEEQLELDPQPQEQAQESPPPVELNDQEQSQGLCEQEQQEDLTQQEQKLQTRPEDPEKQFEPQPEPQQQLAPPEHQQEQQESCKHHHELQELPEHGAQQQSPPEHQQEQQQQEVQQELSELGVEPRLPDLDLENRIDRSRVTVLHRTSTPPVGSNIGMLRHGPTHPRSVSEDDLNLLQNQRSEKAVHVIETDSSDGSGWDTSSFSGSDEGDWDTEAIVPSRSSLDVAPELMPSSADAASKQEELADDDMDQLLPNGSAGAANAGGVDMPDLMPFGLAASMDRNEQKMSPTDTANQHDTSTIEEDKKIRGNTGTSTEHDVSLLEEKKIPDEELIPKEKKHKKKKSSKSDETEEERKERKAKKKEKRRKSELSKNKSAKQEDDELPSKKKSNEKSSSSSKTTTLAIILEESGEETFENKRLALEKARDETENTEDTTTRTTSEHRIVEIHSSRDFEERNEPGPSRRFFDKPPKRSDNASKVFIMKNGNARIRNGKDTGKKKKKQKAESRIADTNSKANERLCTSDKPNLSGAGNEVTLEQYNYSDDASKISTASNENTAGPTETGEDAKGISSKSKRLKRKKQPRDAVRTDASVVSSEVQSAPDNQDGKESAEEKSPSNFDAHKTSSHVPHKRTPIDPPTITASKRVDDDAEAMSLVKESEVAKEDGKAPRPKVKKSRNKKGKKEPVSSVHQPLDSIDIAKTDVEHDPQAFDKPNTTESLQVQSGGGPTENAAGWSDTSNVVAMKKGEQGELTGHGAASHGKKKSKSTRDTRHEDKTSRVAFRAEPQVERAVPVQADQERREKNELKPTTHAMDKNADSSMRTIDTDGAPPMESLPSGSEHGTTESSISKHLSKETKSSRAQKKSKEEKSGTKTGKSKKSKSEQESKEKKKTKKTKKKKEKDQTEVESLCDSSIGSNSFASSKPSEDPPGDMLGPRMGIEMVEAEAVESKGGKQIFTNYSVHKEETEQSPTQGSARKEVKRRGLLGWRR